MNEMTPIEGKQYIEASHRVATNLYFEMSLNEPAESSHKVPTQAKLGAPLLHFSSGARGSWFRRRLLRSFNDVRDYFEVQQMVKEPGEHLARFEVDCLEWVLSVITGSCAVNIHRQHAERYRQTEIQKAAFIENVAFEHLLAGRFDDAKEACRGGLEIYPGSHGLWLNLLVSYSLKGNTAAVDDALFALSEVIDVGNGLVGVYLREVPDLSRPVCNGG